MTQSSDVVGARAGDQVSGAASNKLRFVGIVPARMDSSRLPGKALLQVSGVPLIGYVLARAQRTSSLSDLVIATSQRPVDDPLQEYGRLRGIQVFRGSLNDVAGRMLCCARQHSADYFVRINADSPYVDPDLIDRGIALCIQNEPDMVTNLIGRTFPYGVSVEIVRTAAFEVAYGCMVDVEDREHVTRYFYEYPEAIQIETIVSSATSLGEARMTVDTPEDFKLFEQLVENSGEAFFGLNYQQLAEQVLAQRKTA